MLHIKLIIITQKDLIKKESSISKIPKKVNIVFEREFLYMI